MELLGSRCVCQRGLCVCLTLFWEAFSAEIAQLGACQTYCVQGVVLTAGMDGKCLNGLGNI